MARSIAPPAGPAAQPRHRKKGETESGGFRPVSITRRGRHVRHYDELHKAHAVQEAEAPREDRPVKEPPEFMRGDEDSGGELSPQQLALWHITHPSEHLPPGVHVAELLEMGWTMPQIRTMYPGLFNDEPPAVLHQPETLDWMNPFHHEPDPWDAPGTDETAIPQQHLYPHL